MSILNLRNNRSDIHQSMFACHKNCSLDRRLSCKHLNKKSVYNQTLQTFCFNFSLDLRLKITQFFWWKHFVSTQIVSLVAWTPGRNGGKYWQSWWVKFSRLLPPISAPWRLQNWSTGHFFGSLVVETETGRLVVIGFDSLGISQTKPSASSLQRRAFQPRKLLVFLNIRILA